MKHEGSKRKRKKTSVEGVSKTDTPFNGRIMRPLKSHGMKPFSHSHENGGTAFRGIFRLIEGGLLIR